MESQERKFERKPRRENGNRPAGKPYGAKKPYGAGRPDSGYRPRREDTSAEEISESSVICGRNAVKELLASGRDIEKVYIQKGEREGSILVLIGICAERKIPIIEVDRQKLDLLSHGERHQGIAAAAAEQNYATLDDAFAYAEECGEPPLFVMCDEIEDPHNLGAILRNADCCRVHGVIVPKRRSVGLTQIVAKCSAGAIEHVRVIRVPNLTACAKELKERGVWLYAADMGGESVYRTDLTGASCIVLGNEGSGISRLLKENCDFTVSIPLYGHVDSMNVSCAAAVLLAQAREQRTEKNG